MCLQTNNIIKNRDVVFMEDSIGVGNDLEMHPSGRNKGHTVDECTKSSLCNDGEEGKKQVKYPLVANEAIEMHAENDGPVERFGNIEDVLRKSGAFLESGGRIIFYSNTANKGLIM